MAALGGGRAAARLGYKMMTNAPSLLKRPPDAEAIFSGGVVS